MTLGAMSAIDNPRDFEGRGAVLKRYVRLALFALAVASAAAAASVGMPAMAQPKTPNPTAVSAPPPVPAERNDVLVGSAEDLKRAEGIVMYHKSCPGQPHCYFLRVRWRWPDGYTEEADIPWPYHFSGQNDPVEHFGATHDRVTFSAQDPPKDFHLPHPFQLTRYLCLYFRNQCEYVINAERAGSASPVQTAVPIYRPPDKSGPDTSRT